MKINERNLFLAMMAAAALLSAVGLMYAPFALALHAVVRPIRVSSLAMVLLCRLLAK